MARRDLRGAVVVVTGAAGGLGLAIARRAAADDCRLVLLDVDAERLRAAMVTVPGSHPIVCDITDPGACRAAVAEVLDRLGAIDVLVNNAGVTHRSAFAVNMTKAALETILERKGAIVVVTSVAGFAPVLGRSGYVGAKHALHGLFSTLRAEIASRGVDVTIVSPTFIATDMQRRALDGDGTVTDHPQSRVGRQVDPDVVADRLWNAVIRRRRRVVIGAVGRAARVLMAVAPGLYERLMRRTLRSELDR